MLSNCDITEGAIFAWSRIKIWLAVTFPNVEILAPDKFDDVEMLPIAVIVDDVEMLPLLFIVNNGDKLVGLDFILKPLTEAIVL